MTDRWPDRAGAWREARRALLWEHLLTWVPAYTHAMTALPAGFHSAWARLLRAALLAEARVLAPPPRIAEHWLGRAQASVRALQQLPQPA